MLLKQDKTEAVMAVNARLEYIRKDMWVYMLLIWMTLTNLGNRERVEKQIKDIKEKSEKVKIEVQ